MTNEQAFTRNLAPTELDEQAVDAVSAAGTQHTGGRFMLDVAGHNAGFVQPAQQPQGGGSKGIIAILIGL